MVDNVSVNNDTGSPDPISVATDEVADGSHVQLFKLAIAADGSRTLVPCDVNGLTVQLGAALPAGDAVVGRVKITDGTDVATVRDVTGAKAIDVAIVDGSGTHITSFGGAGGTAAADDADFVAGTTEGTPVQGVYESVPTAVTDGDLGTVGVTTNRELKVSVTASELDVAHDAADAGNPVLVGSHASNVLPARVATDDRTRQLSDLFGRVLTAHIDPAAQVWKGFNATTQQTGATVWDPTAGKKIAITSIIIGTYAATAGRLIIWFGDNADTTYSAGTDQLVFAGSFAPSATVCPGAVIALPHPIYCQTADRELHITTDAALSVDVAVYGYEWV